MASLVSLNYCHITHMKKMDLFASGLLDLSQSLDEVDLGLAVQGVDEEIDDVDLVVNNARSYSGFILGVEGQWLSVVKSFDGFGLGISSNQRKELVVGGERGLFPAGQKSPAKVARCTGNKDSVRRHGDIVSLSLVISDYGEG